jgi:DHA3 family macrolide efflux protein-like MFS transporter
LSLLIAGPIADALGVRVWYVVGGVLCIVIGALAFAAPAIMHVEDNGHPTKAHHTTLDEAAAAASMAE